MIADSDPVAIEFALEFLEGFEGSKPVLALMEAVPFDGVPPPHIRAQVYEYKFTSFEERRQTGNAGKRSNKFGVSLGINI